ncbi:MAG: hypothetical protein ACLFWB_10725 [Armatimonadota bacterium]
MKRSPIAALFSSPMVGLMLTIPFALALNSSRVQISTTIHRDGSGLRQVAAEAGEYYARDLPGWTRDAEAGKTWQRYSRSSSKTQSTVTVTRDFLSSNMNQVGDTLTFVDVFQKPLDIYTTYTWTETVQLKYHYDTNPAEARAGEHEMQYAVTMPGVITDATCDPIAEGGQDISGNTVTFTLAADNPEHTITVHSRHIRWEYLAIAAWIVLFILVKIIGFIVQRRRTRPRRI